MEIIFYKMLTTILIFIYTMWIALGYSDGKYSRGDYRIKHVIFFTYFIGLKLYDLMNIKIGGTK